MNTITYLDSIEEFILINGQRVGGYTDNRKLYNIYEKEIREKNHFTIHVSELKKWKNFSSCNPLAINEIKQLIRIAVYNLWKVNDISMVMKP